MGMATAPDRANVERDLKFPLLLMEGTVQLRADDPLQVNSRVLNAQTMRLIAEVQRLRMAASRPDTAGEPDPGMIRPGDTGTTVEQRWEVLTAYRRWRGKGLHSDDALTMVRMARVLEWAETGSALPTVLDSIDAELAYIDKVLRPRVERWNYDRPGLFG